MLIGDNMCNHQYKEYLGLNERFDYCEACGQKKSDIESEYVEVRIKNYMELRGGEIMVPRTLTRTGLVALKEKYEKRFETMENKIVDMISRCKWGASTLQYISLSSLAYKILVDELGDRADFRGSLNILQLHMAWGKFSIYVNDLQFSEIVLIHWE
jgi:hypothetical protein